MKHKYMGHMNSKYMSQDKNFGKDKRIKSLED